MRLGRGIAGMVLIVIAIAAIVYWESVGRQEATTEQVLVAAKEIEMGSIIEQNFIKTIPVLKESVVKSGCKSGEEALVLGRRAGALILENQQFSTEHMKTEKGELKKGTELYVIKPQWIDSISGAVRKGDMVRIYDSLGDIFMGEYMVAFVKDNTNQEVVDMERPNSEKKILDRTHSTGAVNHLEIQATREEYKIMALHVEEMKKGLLIVQIDKGIVRGSENE